MVSGENSGISEAFDAFRSSMEAAKLMTKKKDVLTTGQVARICNVAPRTVSKWFDSGQLRGYRIPGSKDRRIPIDQLVRFMQAHGMPLNGLDSGTVRVLLVDDKRDLVVATAEGLERTERFTVRTAECGFDAGVEANQFHPHVIVMDIMLEDIDVRRICKLVHENPDLAGTRIVAVASSLTDGEGQALLQHGFDAYLCRPFELSQLIQAIDEATSIIH